MDLKPSFRPRILNCLADYDRSRFLADLNAGFVVGILALSLCIGLGIASGVTPAAGLYSSIVGGFIVSALGGSRVQIGGPAGAFVGLVALAAANYGLPNLLLCTLLAWWSGTWQRRVPGSIVVVVLGTVAVALFDLEVATVAKFIPLASLGAVLTIVAFRMGDWHEFLTLRRYPLGDALVFLTAFALTVLIDLTWAVYVGMLMSAFLFIKRVADTTQVDALRSAEGGEGASWHVKPIHLPPGVLVYRVFGSLLFGAAEKLDYVLRRVGRDTRVIVLHVATVTAMDATALNRLESLHDRMRRHGRQLILSGLHTQPYALIEMSGFFDELGWVNLLADLDAAVARARELTDSRPV